MVYGDYKKVLVMLFLFYSSTNQTKNRTLRPKRSSVEAFKGSSAYYNHFIIDDRVAPGRVWNEEFTSGIR